MNLKSEIREPIAKLRKPAIFLNGYPGASIRRSMANALQDIWQHLQRQLFPVLVEEVGELGEKDQRFVEIVALLPLGPLLTRYDWKRIGCPPHARAWLVHAFIAKEVYQYATREALVDALKARPTLRRLCGWESASAVPSLSTFCRAFAQFAADGLPQAIHEALVKQHCGPKLVGHISRDATAIPVPERPAPAATTERMAPAAPRKRGRPKHGEAPPPPPPTRLQLQPQRSLTENLADLPQACDSGAKRGSKGHMEYWRGYKLHLDVIDGDIPISAVLTSASTHDSQVAIPLMQMSAQRVTALYQLMDAGYDAEAIHAYVRTLGQVPIIEPVQRGDWVPLDPAQRRRFAERSASERVNGRLKDFFGGRTVRVRGAAKVMCHLMFGILAITAANLWQRLC
jgi:hypothetical protein